MALATQCPHCGTIFRVAHDQLKLRAGLVRCGACKEIFNGIEQLLPADETTAGANDTPPIAASAQPDPPKPVETDPAPKHPPEPPIANDPAPEAEPVATTSALESAAGFASFETRPAVTEKNLRSERFDNDVAASGIEIDPLQRMTLMNFASGPDLDGHDPEHDTDRLLRAPSSQAEEPTDSAEDSDRLDQVIDELQRKPPRAERKRRDASERHAEGDTSEPDFMLSGRRQQRQRGWRIVLASASTILFAALLAQAVYVLRTPIAAWFPAVKPALTAACITLRCQVELPMQIELVTIESSELQALAGGRNALALGVLLRNRSTTVEAWPQIELTLNDAAEKPVVRRVFAPKEYLPASAAVADGFAANSEQALRIVFDLEKPKASGYRIYLFYP